MDSIDKQNSQFPHPQIGNGVAVKLRDAATITKASIRFTKKNGENRYETKSKLLLLVVVVVVFFGVFCRWFDRNAIEKMDALHVTEQGVFARKIICNRNSIPRLIDETIIFVCVRQWPESNFDISTFSMKRVSLLSVFTLKMPCISQSLSSLSQKHHSTQRLCASHRLNEMPFDLVLPTPATGADIQPANTNCQCRIRTVAQSESRRRRRRKSISEKVYRLRFTFSDESIFATYSKCKD